jgi:uncharacterized repeat protein (TIGR03803 family)
MFPMMPMTSTSRRVGGANSSSKLTVPSNHQPAAFAGRRAYTRLAALCLAVLATALFAMPANAQANPTIYNFCSETNCDDGAVAYTDLVFDAKGNAYGVTFNGGPYSSSGVAYEVSPPAGGSGTWTSQTLYLFGGATNDPINPTSSLIFDSHGNLYGVAQSGGANGRGAVYELSPPAGGGVPWTLKLLYSFPESGNQGFDPVGTLTFDASGNLYGTTNNSEVGDGGGAVFKLSPRAGGGVPWTLTVLWSFGVNTAYNDGYGAYAGVVFRNGNLYGTTTNGGLDDFECGTGCGTVYELTPPAGGGSGLWTETLLWSFPSNATDGEAPYSKVVFDSAGNIYGTTNNGGVSGDGTVFELSPPAGGIGSWTENILYSFCPNGASGCTDAVFPEAEVTFDSAGNIYTTAAGGLTGRGTVVELSPPAGGGTPWNESVLYNFCSLNACDDGAAPRSGLVADSKGNVYGVTWQGGANNEGTVYKFPPFTSVSLTSSPNPSNYGENVVMTATVTSGSGKVTSGTVEFYDGSTLITGVNVNSSGVATLDYANLPAGTDNLKAVYLGNGDFFPSTSAAVAQTVNADATMTALTSSPNPSTYGGNVVMTATVTSAGGKVTSGTVEFYDGSTLITGVNLNASGVATLTYANLPAGTDTLKAVYLGYGSFSSSTSAVVMQTVNANATMTALTSSPNPSTHGSTVTMTATVTSSNGKVPGGTVQFYDGSTVITGVNLNASGVATLTYANLPTGTDNLKAVYLGYGGFSTSTSPTIMQTVNP